MSEQLKSEHLAAVIPIDRGRTIERINGIKLNLGAMSVPELTTLAERCVARLEDARTDHMIITDHIAGRQGGGPGSAA